MLSFLLFILNWLEVDVALAAEICYSNDELY